MLDPKQCEKRLERFTRLCREEGLDLAIVSDRKNVYYFTGFLRSHLAWMEARMELLLVFPAWGAVLVVSKTFAEDAQRCYPGELLIYKDYDLHDKTATYPEDVVEVLRQFLPGKGPLGNVGIESRYLPATIESAVRELCGGVKLLDISTWIPELRKKKDADELELIKEGVRLHKEGYAVARKVLRRGISEIDVYAAVLGGMSRKYDDYLFFGGDFVSGERGVKVGGPPTRKILRQGELLILDFWVMAHGYWADTARTLVVGDRPNPEQRRIHRLVLKALKAGEEYLRPGNRACDVYEAVRSVFELEGLAPCFTCHAGHGIGLHPHESPLLIPGSTEVLEAGMVATLEPGLYVEGFGGLRCEEDYFITANGPEKLTRFSQSL